MRTKGVKAYFIFTLILGIIFSYGIFTFIEYDYRNTFIARALSIFFPAIISLIFAIKVFKKGQKTIANYDVSNDTERLIKEVNKYISKNSFVYIIIIGLACYFHDHNIYFNSEVNSSFNVWLVFSYLLFAVVAILPANFVLFYTFRKFKHSIPGAISKVTGIISIFMIIFLLVVSVYKCVPINAFKYLYDVNDGVEIKDKIFADARISTNEVVIPEKIFGTKVTSLNNIDAKIDKLTLPNTIDSSKLDNFFSPNTSINEIVSGEVILKDGVIYSKDMKYVNVNSPLIISNYKDSTFVIPKETMYIKGDLTNLPNLSSIEVEEGNDVFIANGGALYVTSDNCENVGMSVAPGEVTLVIPSKMGSVITIDDVHDVTVNLNTKIDNYKIKIGKNCKNITINGNASLYEVDPDNMYYSSFQGNLYSKDRSELLLMADRVSTETIAKETKFISNQAIKVLNKIDRIKNLYMIRLEQPSQYMVLVNGMLMNKAQSIIYAISDRRKLQKEIPVGSAVRLISPELLYLANNFANDDSNDINFIFRVNPSNPYISRINGEVITYKEGWSSIEKLSIRDEEKKATQKDTGPDMPDTIQDDTVYSDALPVSSSTNSVPESKETKETSGDVINNSSDVTSNSSTSGDSKSINDKSGDN